MCEGNEVGQGTDLACRRRVRPNPPGYMKPDGRVLIDPFLSGVLCTRCVDGAVDELLDRSRDVRAERAEQRRALLRERNRRG